MPFRVTEASSNARLLAQITASRQRVETAQERIASGKRINRPSDDPIGAGAVVRLRTTQTQLEQYERNAGTAHDTLLAADGALEAYETALDRVRSLLTQGASDFASSVSKPLIADEVESLRSQILSLANQRYGDRYLFGGTRQEIAPYDTNGVPAATPSTPQLLQIDPDNPPLATGVTAETVFADATGTIFTELDSAITALNGTGDPVADRAALLASMDRITALTDQARVTRAQVGVGLARAQAVTEQLEVRSLALEETVQRTEGADFVEAALDLSESQNVLDAILQAKAKTSGRSLLDLLG